MIDYLIILLSYLINLLMFELVLDYDLKMTNILEKVQFSVK